MSLHPPWVWTGGGSVPIGFSLSTSLWAWIAAPQHVTPRGRKIRESTGIRPHIHGMLRELVGGASKLEMKGEKNLLSKVRAMGNFSPCCDRITDPSNIREEGFNLVHGSKALSTVLVSHGDRSRGQLVISQPQ